MDRHEFRASRVDLSVQWLSRFEAGLRRDEIQIARVDVRWSKITLVASEPEHMRLELKPGLRGMLGHWLLPSRPGLTVVSEADRSVVAEVFYHQRELRPANCLRFRANDDTFFDDSGSKLGRMFSAWRDEDIEQDILYHFELAEDCDPLLAVLGPAVIAMRRWPKELERRFDPLDSF